jgi:Bacterial protein of unknown function (DUF885)
MIGHLRILELREQAKAALGAKFSIKEFHNLVLRGGSMPLPDCPEIRGCLVREQVQRATPAETRLSRTCWAGLAYERSAARAHLLGRLAQP